MTKQEYAEYERAVDEFFQREGIQNLSDVPDEDGNYEDFFSWRPCDCCGTHLGGSRQDANGWNPTTKEILDFTVCTDCLYYVEYGRLDDMTMQEMESE